MLQFVLLYFRAFPVAVGGSMQHARDIRRAAMPKVHKHIIKGRSRLDVELRTRDWQQQMAGEAVNVQLHPVEPIKEPTAPESQGKLEFMDTHQKLLEYGLKPRKRKSR
jgi:hypothetical protein